MNTLSSDSIPSSAQGVAVITGASAGIGATYAQRLARRGYDLLLVARDQARLAALAAQLQHDTGVNVEIFKADLTQKSDLLALEKRLREDARITMLVNNAGMAVSGQLIEIDPDRLETLIQLNVLAVTRLAAAVMPNLIAKRGGTLINIASVLALAPELFNGAYSATKAFVLNLSQSLQKEAEPHGVRVQVVLPGATRTEIWARSGMDIAHLPAEMLMDVEEMVDAALKGLDQGEAITLPSLPDMADWQAFTAARHHLIPNLSRSHAAARYHT